MRVLSAAHQLLLSHGKVADLAHEVGFTGINNFAKQFKKLMKVPPSHYLLEDDE